MESKPSHNNHFYILTGGPGVGKTIGTIRMSLFFHRGERFTKPTMNGSKPSTK